MMKADRGKERAERQRRLALEVLQEWDGKHSSEREPSAQRVAHDMVHRLFGRLQEGAFGENSKEKNA